MQDNKKRNIYIYIYYIFRHTDNCQPAEDNSIEVTMPSKIVMTYGET